MAHRPKTRFTASVDGKEIELFSVLERRDSTLVVISAVPCSFETSTGLSPFAEQHYSIHASRDGNDTTITQKTSLKSGASVSNVTFIPDTAAHLLWPIYARRVPLFDLSRMPVSSRLRDRRFNVGSYETKSAALIYTALVSRSSFDKRHFDRQPLVPVSADFREYSVHVYVSYMNLPSPALGDVIGYSSSTPVLDKTRRSSHRQITVSSFPPEMAADIHIDMAGRLRSATIQRIAAIVDAPTFHEILRSPLSQLLSSEPLLPLIKRKRKSER